jgi:hypothetical protein
MSNKSQNRPLRSARHRAAAGAAAAWVLFAALVGGPAFADADGEVAAQLARLAERLAQQETRLAAQERQLAEQSALLAAQAAQIETQRKRLVYGLAPEPESAVDLDAMRGAGPGGADQIILLGQAATGDAAATNATTIRPVGEAPRNVEAPPIVTALPEGQGVLTPPGKLVIDPSFEYSRSSSNRLVYRGVEIVTGIQVGLIEANDADRDTVVSAVAARYGVTPRLEVEARIPYVYRFDRILTLAQRDSTISRQQELEGSGFGDLEASARYQLNRGLPGHPIFVAGLRVKSDTGKSPFDVSRDSFGVADKLPTGSGFWGVSPSLSVMYPTDPVVLFANLSYLYNAPRDIDKNIGGAPIGRVDPGDSVGGGMGFGFALNDRFSYSLGYSHQYLFETTTEIGGVDQQSASLHVGAFQFGMSLRVNPRVNISTSVELGATKDAPDMRAVVRVPVGLQLRTPQNAAQRRPRTEVAENRPWWKRALPRW